MKRVVIVGGGIAGLATAYYLQKHGGADIRLVESAPTFGGKIVSRKENGFVIEGGPDSFITTKTAALELCRELGLGDELIGTNDAGRKVFVWSRGQLRQMPDGVMLIIPTRIMPFVRSPLISWPGKLRMGMDLFIPPRRHDGDESLAGFVRRRLGAEALDRIAEPMIAGIYVADAEYLSLKSTFPRFLDMEKKYGGLLRGVLAQKRASNGKAAPAKPSTSLFMTLRGGLHDLVDGILSRLDRKSLTANREAVRITRASDGYEVTLNDGTCLQTDAVVMASPAYVTAQLLQGVDSRLADSVGAIRYVSTATVSLGYRQAELSHPLNGFGFVVPRSEQRKIIACTWSSTKFDHRAPQGHALVRAFVGGAHAEHLAEQDDESIAQSAREELRAMMGIAAEPVVTRVYRWPKANPQYAVGHEERIAKIDSMAEQHAGLFLVGGAYHGVGIPDCIADGKRVADLIVNSST